jgi:DNA-directed RNA polymerase I subunit RPA43
MENDTAKKNKDRNIEHHTKKRKRKTDEDSGHIAAKKRRSLAQTHPATVKDVPNIQLEDVNLSPFYEKIYSLYLPISPISYQYPLSGICAEHLSPLILKYYPPFHGVVLSYSNAKLSAHSEYTLENEKPGPVLARSVDEYAASFVWITAHFLIFSPTRGNSIEGWINIQNQGNLGLLCWNFFNVHIERKRLPKDWTWVSGTAQTRSGRNHDIDKSAPGSEGDCTNRIGIGEGYFQDGKGTRVEGLIRFQVRDVESSRSLDRENTYLSINGTMLKPEEELALQKHEAGRLERSTKRLMKGVVNGSRVGDLVDIDRPTQLNHDSVVE